MVTQQKLNRCYSITKRVLQGATYRAVGEEENICTERARQLVMFFFRWVLSKSSVCRSDASNHGYCDIKESRKHCKWWLERMKELGFE